MSQVRGVVLGGMIVIVLFDALGAAAADALGFSRALLVPGSLLIYGAVAALVARRRSWLAGLLAAIAIAATELTVGWEASRIAAPEQAAQDVTVMTVLGAIMTAFVGAMLAGSIGAWLGARRHVPQ